MKNLKTSIITILALLSFVLINNSHAQPPEIRSPLSYAKIILNPNFRDSFKYDFNDQCFKLIYNHYKKGGNLSCKSLAETAIPLENFTNDSNIYLYHYSKSIIAYENFQSTEETALKLEHFFEFFRKRDSYDSSPYFASDSRSSREFGKYLIKFKIDPKAKILLNSNSTAIQNCSNEIEKNLPTFSNSCEITFWANHANKLALMILEDSGVALYDYYSYFYRNYKDYKKEIPRSWLQLTGPEWILEAESTKKKIF